MRSKSVVMFEGLNENHSYCSAWLKDKDRFCRRTVADGDQKKRRILLQSISCGREYTSSNTDEVVDLYFCKGWHRKGGRYAIPSTERLKVLQMCFPMVQGVNEASTTPQPDEMERRTAPPSRYPPSRNVVGHRDSPFSLAPVRITGKRTASLPSDIPGSFMTNIGSIFEGSEIAEAEQLSFSIAQSAANSMENDVSTPAAISPLVSFRAESSPAEAQPWERDFQQQAQAEHLSPDDAIETVSIPQLRRSARIQGLEPVGHSEASRLTGQVAALPLTTPATRTRQRTRLQEQEIGPQQSTDHPTNDREPSSRFAPEIRRRSARIQRQGQGQHANVGANVGASGAPALQNASVSSDRDHIQLSASTRGPLKQRMTRDVNEIEDCGICKEALGAGRNVARCYNCANDFHKYCLAQWFTTGSKTCGFCRAPFSIAQVKLLVESLGDGTLGS